MSLPLDLMARYLGVTAGEIRSWIPKFQEVVAEGTKNGINEAFKLYPPAKAPFFGHPFDLRVGITVRATILQNEASVLLFNVPAGRQGKITHFGITSPNPVAYWIGVYSLLINNQAVTDYNEIRDQVNPSLASLTEIGADLQPGARVEVRVTSTRPDFNGNSPEFHLQATARIKGYLN